MTAHLQSGSTPGDVPTISDCETYLLIGHNKERDSASNGFIDIQDARDAAAEAVLLADLPDVQNLRIAEPEHLGFFNVYEPRLVADGPHGELAVTVRFKAGTTTPVELQFYDVNHPQLAEWITDLSGAPLGEARALKFQGTASFAMASFPSRTEPGSEEIDKAA